MGIFSKLKLALTTGAQERIATGAFGYGNPSFAFADVNPTPIAPLLARYHEASLFTPGAENFVYDPQFELPMHTIWGFGFMRYPNTFNPLQPMQPLSSPVVTTNGIGGLIAGTMQLQSLEIEGG